MAVYLLLFFGVSLLAVGLGIVIRWRYVLEEHWIEEGKGTQRW